MSTRVARRADVRLATAIVAAALVVAACGNAEGQRIAELENQLADAEAQLESGGWAADGATFDEPVPVSPEYLAGIWLLDGEGALLRFSEDGTYAIDRRGTLDTEPQDFGTYAIDGTTLTFTAAEGTRLCEAGDTIVWENVGLIETGRMIGTIVTDECIGPSNTGYDWTWTIVSPRRSSNPT